MEHINYVRDNVWQTNLKDRALGLLRLSWKKPEVSKKELSIPFLPMCSSPPQQCIEPDDYFSSKLIKIVIKL